MFSLKRIEWELLIPPFNLVDLTNSSTKQTLVHITRSTWVVKTRLLNGTKEVPMNIIKIVWKQKLYRQQQYWRVFVLRLNLESTAVKVPFPSLWNTSNILWLLPLRWRSITFVWSWGPLRSWASFSTLSNRICAYTRKESWKCHLRSRYALSRERFVRWSNICVKCCSKELLKTLCFN